MIEYNHSKGYDRNKDKKLWEVNIMKKFDVLVNKSQETVNTYTIGGDFMKKVNGLFKKVISTLSAVVLATAGAGSFATKSNAAYDDPDFLELAEQVIVLVNEARAEEGLDPIYAVPYLCDAATIRSEECVESFSHTRTNGEKFTEVIDYDVTPWATAAENIACGMSTAEETFEQWRNSPKHWAAIMNPEYTHMGVGVTYDPDSTYNWYWEQLFIKVDTYEVPDGEIEGQYIPEKYRIVPQSVGDITGDGVIDSFDYILLCQYINKKVTLNPLQVESADVLKDGVITYSDAAGLRKYILGEVEQLPISIF